ncbi:MAG: MCE family protein, partial [Alistipes sp.]|nr:MCE family protein [Alistipes sp.]
VISEISNPNGTLGNLLNNKELYANLTQASANLEALLGDLKQNPHRYVHFSLFGADEEKLQAKAEKKAAKAEKKAAKK